MLLFCVTSLLVYIVGQWQISSLLINHSYIFLISSLMVLFTIEASESDGDQSSLPPSKKPRTMSSPDTESGGQ